MLTKAIQSVQVAIVYTGLCVKKQGSEDKKTALADKSAKLLASPVSGWVIRWFEAHRRKDRMSLPDDVTIQRILRPTASAKDPYTATPDELWTKFKGLMREMLKLNQAYCAFVKDGNPSGLDDWDCVRVALAMYLEA